MSIPNILTFASEKGGVLKTTLVLHAARFALVCAWWQWLTADSSRT